MLKSPKLGVERRGCRLFGCGFLFAWFLVVVVVVLMFFY